MNRARIRLLPLLLCAMFPLASACRTAEVVWNQPDWNAAAAKAKAENKLVHVFVEGDNCPPCEMYKKTHLADPAYVDFANSMFVNVRVHEGDPAGQKFIEQLKLRQGVVPRFYVLTPEGKGVSMFLGMVDAPPMEASMVLRAAAGRELPVDRARAAEVAGRLRTHAAAVRASGRIDPNNPFRPEAIASLEAQAWALAGRLDEAEKAFGANWAGKVSGQEVRQWYVQFWLGWNRNFPGALIEAKAYYDASEGVDPNGWWLMAQALAANGRYAEAVDFGDRLLGLNPNDQRVRATVDEWRKQAGR